MTMRILLWLCLPLVGVTAFFAGRTTWTTFVPSIRTTTTRAIRSSQQQPSCCLVPLWLSSKKASVVGTAYRVEQVKTDDDILNVASFRNNLTNPEMLVAKQQAKKDSIDPVEAGFNGLKVGLLIIGPIFGLFTWYNNNSVEDGLAVYAVLGGVSGVMAGLNNLFGNRVYVMTEAEATNRLLVDYAENLKRKADVGFVAISSDPKYENVGGIMAAADIQVRNSPKSPAYAQKVSNLPPHVHLRNMLVDVDMRRKGVARALVDKIVQYAKNEADVDLITLEVEGKNEAAIKLYESEGFQVDDSKSRMLGRKFMSRQL